MIDTLQRQVGPGDGEMVEEVEVQAAGGSLRVPQGGLGQALRHLHRTRREVHVGEGVADSLLHGREELRPDIG